MLNNKEEWIATYNSGFSIPQTANKYGVSKSVVRYTLWKAGVLRSRDDGIRLAAKEGRLGNAGPRKPFSDEHKKNISEGRLRWANAGNCIGVSLKKNGYVEHTRGPHKGRSVHVVKMEERLGRPLRDDECVHHIDGDKTNNEDNNLALVTKSGHARLHRFEDSLAGNIRERKDNGRFS